MNWEELNKQLTVHGHANTGAVWDLKGYSFRKNNETPMWSTNESGLPIFPGLVRYDEVSAGHIDHALAMNVPAMQNTWVWPARSAQSNSWCNLSRTSPGGTEIPAESIV